LLGVKEKVKNIVIKIVATTRETMATVQSAEPSA